MTVNKVKKYTLTPVLIVLALCFCTLILTASGTTARASAASSLETQINAITGLHAEVSGSSVTVTGTAHSTKNIPLSIGDGVTVNWEAELTGQAAENNYLLTLTGTGSFNLNSGTVKLTSGAGGAMYIADAVTLNINGGSIENPGSGSALLVSAGVQNAVINMTGGFVKSLPNGYAISDGAGMTASTNNTKINISGGLVESGSACAIRSTGSASVVTVTGGEVRNAASSNSNPAINMIYSPAPNNNLYNVVISGGLVRTINSGNLSYVIQTTQNILVEDGEVASIAGRGINLIGAYSVASITGGRVSTATGTAISTATTTLDDITNAKVVITGGIVEATDTGKAVVITGYNSTVEVSGSAQVLAKSGLAIDASGRPAADSVTVSGGFVFAWGSAITGAGNVIQPANKLNHDVGGVIAAWNTHTGIGPEPYYQEERDDLTMMPDESVYWDKNPDGYFMYRGDGISYSNGDTKGFFELNVEVIKKEIYYVLTVNTGSGPPIYISCRAGDEVTVSAAPGQPVNTDLDPEANPENGTAFVKWVIDSGGGSLADESDADTVFTMPENDAVITAKFTPFYLLHVIGGTINISDRNFGQEVSYGYYAPGTVVGISANDDEADKFAEWASNAGGTFSDKSSLSTAFTMPGSAAAVYPVQSETPDKPPVLDYTTEIISNSGTITSTPLGTALPYLTKYTGPAGSLISVQARESTGDEVFSHWEIVSGRGLFGDPHMESTTFTAQEDTQIRAIFVTPVTYRLTIIMLSGETVENHKSDDLVILNAEQYAEGMQFDHWEQLSGHGTLGNDHSSFTTFTMPGEDVVLKATYMAIDPGTDPIDPGTDPVDPGIDPIDPGIDPGTDPVEPAVPGVDPADPGPVAPAPVPEVQTEPPAPAPRTGVQTHFVLAAAALSVSFAGIVIVSRKLRNRN